MNFFRQTTQAPSDPILGLNERFSADANPNKVNLGMGVYVDGDGKLPLLRSVATAEARLTEGRRTRGYLPIEGGHAFTRAAASFTFGPDLTADAASRIATVQALGGTGGLRVAADFLRRFHGAANVLVSDPTWDNHKGIFGEAGFKVGRYPYYCPKLRDLDFAGLCEKLSAASQGTIVVLHACCHNPTGVDLSDAQWREVIRILGERELLPVLDMAYQGFGSGVVEDGRAARMLLQAGLNFFVATSFSKSFGLYGERVGALSVVTHSPEEADRVMSQLKISIRTNYSTPPTHGAALVAQVLGDDQLRADWHRELSDMRNRIRAMRTALRSSLEHIDPWTDYSFVTRQNGMFTFSGLDAAQMQRLRQEYSVYGVDSGRICVAGLNTFNVAYVAGAMASVMGVGHAL